MKKIISLMLIYFSSFVWAQQAIDYSEYNDLMLTIEACNARESFDSSIQKYSTVFTKYERVFAADAYNACQIAALKKHKYFPDFFYKCAHSGISKTRLLSNALIKDMFITDSTNLNVLYSKGNKAYLKRIDANLREEMIKRSRKEQESKGKPNYASICTDNFNRILELTKAGKYPSENLIGIDDDIENIVFPTLCHYPYSFKILQPYFTEAVMKGKITPLSILYLYGFNQMRRSVLYTNDIPVDTTNFKIAYNIPYGKESYDFKEVNKQRAIKKVPSMSVHTALRNLRAKYGLDYLIAYY
jgi:hypothetical protein